MQTSCNNINIINKCKHHFHIFILYYQQIKYDENAEFEHEASVQDIVKI